jgi:Protein of unknown function (DUF2800)
MSDSRAGLPSASSFGRYSSCPGSFRLEREQPECEQSADASRGTRIHEALATAKHDTLTAEDEATLERCLELEARLLEELMPPAASIEREKRLWLLDQDSLEPRFSGQVDGLAVGADSALVWDFKTGRQATDPAESNWQLRALAVLVADNYHVDRVLVALLQPWVSPSVTIAEYGPGDLAVSRLSVVGLARKVMEPGQPRIASEAACKYCRAQAVCPERTVRLKELAALSLHEPRNGLPLQGEDIARYLDVCRDAERLIFHIRARAKTMLDLDPDSIPGWRLKPGMPRQAIHDLATVWGRARELGVLPEVFVEACALTKKNARQMLHISTGARGQALETRLADMLEGCTTTKITAPQLVRISDNDGEMEAITSESTS